MQRTAATHPLPPQPLPPSPLSLLGVLHTIHYQWEAFFSLSFSQKFKLVTLVNAQLLECRFSLTFCHITLLRMKVLSKILQARGKSNALTHRHRQTDALTHSHTYTQTHRHRQIDRQTHPHTHIRTRTHTHTHTDAKEKPRMMTMSSTIDFMPV